MANYRRVARRAARREGIDPRVFERQINLESGFNPNAKSPKGAIGIAQFIPSTARSEGVNPRNPKQALRGAARLDAKLVRQTGSMRKALAAYNAGPGNIKAGLGYADSILQGRAAHTHVGGGGGTRTVKTPGVNNAAQRRDLVAQYLLRGSGLNTSSLNDVTDPFGTQQAAASTAGTSSLVALAKGLKRAKDVPGGTRTVSTGGSAAHANVKGTALFEGHRVAAWIKPELVYARKHGWKGTVTSGFRSFADQTRIYNSGTRPAAKPGTSNHEGADFPRGAVDVSSPQQLSNILRRKGSALKYAGAKDPVHFSHPHGGSY